MSQKIFCYIPEMCINRAGDVSAQVRTMLTQALAQGLAPMELPLKIHQSVVDLTDEHIAVISPMAKQLKLAPGRVVGGLLFALFSKTKPPQSQILVTEGLRTAQAACLEAATPMLAQGKIVFAEAGTGSGKSRMIAHAAAFAIKLRDQKAIPQLRPLTAQRGLPDFLLRYAQQAQDVQKMRMEKSAIAPCSVIVCAPSIENVVHLLKEWEAVRGALDPQSLVKLAVVLGRTQFVSPTKLSLLLGELDEPCPEIQKWLDEGMVENYSESTKVLARSAKGIFGLMADLEWLAKGTGLTAQDAELDEDCSDDEMQAYQTLRDKADGADLVMTSTAMLAIDNMHLANQESTNLLPYPLALFIDEAHTLESIQASMVSKSLSFFRLSAELRGVDWKNIRKDSASKDVLAALKTAAKALENIPDQTQLPITAAHDKTEITAWHAAQPAIVALYDALSRFTKGLVKPSETVLTKDQKRAVRYAQQSLIALGHIQEGWKGHITQSPKRHQIGFMVGPSSVQKFLLARWETTPMAMLLSGTLSHIGASGSTIAPIKAEMSVPPDRDAVTPPLHPSWIYSTPTIFKPASEVFHEFIPPAGLDADEVEMTLWLRRCAKAINFAASSAAGGTMVLMTSFDRLEGLAIALRERHSALNDRLIIQGRHQRLSQSADLFRVMASQGIKPVWIVTGAAWTGLDMSDKSIPDHLAGQDNLLTDLVIPNLPFGLDRTTTHASRLGRVGFGAEIVGVQRRFRQGLGRLVRREGLLNRRIWILDGRLQHPAAQTYTADLQRVLKLYLHHESFNP